MRPRIGITTSTLKPTADGLSLPRTATPLAYSRRVYAAGGLPLLLPNVPELEVEKMLPHLDGLLLSGGGDVDPARWGEPPHPALGQVDPLRDRLEIALVLGALARDLPLLGICRGAQVMAVADGGDLWQDIPSQCQGEVEHFQSCPRHLPSHKVTLPRDGALARALGPALPLVRPRGSRPAGGDNLTLRVNSFHHQAARKCGSLFTAEGRSSDGLTEALTAPGATFALGVQWHPEEMAETDPAQARLFTAFVEAARGRT